MDEITSRESLVITSAAKIGIMILDLKKKLESKQ